MVVKRNMVDKVLCVSCKWFSCSLALSACLVQTGVSIHHFSFPSLVGVDGPNGLLLGVYEEPSWAALGWGEQSAHPPHLFNLFSE